MGKKKSWWSDQVTWKKGMIIGSSLGLLYYLITSLNGGYNGIFALGFGVPMVIASLISEGNISTRPMPPTFLSGILIVLWSSLFGYFSSLIYSKINPKDNPKTIVTILGLILVSWVVSALILLLWMISVVPET